jgi:outer membrane protein OmpA-like peptidoglycan-associated protein
MSRRSIIFAAALVGFAGFAGYALAQNGPLLQPGEPYPGTQTEPIQLHLPIHKPASARTPTPSATDDASVATAAEPPAQIDLIHPPRHKHTASGQVANTAPATSEPLTVPFSLDGRSPSVAPSPSLETAPSKSSKHGLPATREASLGPSTMSERSNLTKRGAILFEKGAPAPSPAQYKGVKILATDLNSALEKGAAAIQLEAYGGTPGDKSSDARRLALRRALAVRQLLIDDGVPSARIDVRAMGGSEDKGSSDRVDVFIRAG